MSFRKSLFAITGSLALAGQVVAGEVFDPYAMQTHELEATVSFYTMTDVATQEFNPASAYAECVHAMVGDHYNATIAAADECSSTEDNVDIVRFEWSNLNMHSSMFGISATGTTGTTFSLTKDGSIGLDAITNLETLASVADWSIDLFDADENLIGSLGDSGTSYDLLKDTEYELVFSMNGSNTLTDNGALVTWDVAIAYAGGSAVPGAGGIAALLALGARTRRRRRA